MQLSGFLPYLQLLAQVCLHPPPLPPTLPKAVSTFLQGHLWG